MAEFNSTSEVEGENKSKKGSASEDGEGDSGFPEEGDQGQDDISGNSNENALGDEEDSPSDIVSEEKLKFAVDIPLTVSVELGRVSMKIRELLRLNLGSVLEIDKLAGEPLEVLINGKYICRGEVIVINEKYGIRMTDIIKPSDSDKMADPQMLLPFKTT